MNLSKAFFKDRGHAVVYPNFYVALVDDVLRRDHRNEFIGSAARLLSSSTAVGQGCLLIVLVPLAMKMNDREPAGEPLVEPQRP